MIERVDHELALEKFAPGGGRNRVVLHHPDHVPSTAHAPRLGDSIHLAPGFLSARRGHDRSSLAGTRKGPANWLVWVFINFWIRYGFLNSRKPRGAALRPSGL